MYRSSPVLVYFMLALVQQEPTSKRELRREVSKLFQVESQGINNTYQSSIYAGPSEQHAKVESNA